MTNRRKYPRFKKIYWLYFVLIELTLLAYIAQAAEKIIKEPSWYEHVDLMTMIIIGLISIVGFFIIRLLNRIDKNQTETFINLKDLNSRLSRLEGAHDVYTKNSIHGG